MSSESALDRVARVIDLIPFLHQRQVPIKELADGLGQSISELERDLEIAFLCGLPGYTPDLLIDLSMEEGFVAVSNPQSLDTARRLSLEEMTSLRLGLELLQLQYPGATRVRETFQSLWTKLGQASHDESNAWIEGASGDSIEAIESAILSSSRISFDYVDAVGKKTTGRKVSPHRFVWRGGRLLLSGFDHDRGDVREFFISQMTQTRMIEGEVKIDDQKHDLKNQSTSLNAEITFRTLPMWWKRRNSAFIVDMEINATASKVILQFWNEEWLARALVPVLDLIEKVNVEGVSDQRLRSLILSHFSASESPL